MKAVEVNNLRKSYPKKIPLPFRKVEWVEAVKGISFEVKRGELFGLLGPNGAGKTTTIKMLTTLLEPSGGERQNTRTRPHKRCKGNSEEDKPCGRGREDALLEALRL